MTIAKLKNGIHCAVASLLVFLAFPVWAQEADSSANAVEPVLKGFGTVGDHAGLGSTNSSFKTLPQIIGNIINVALGLVGVIMVVLMIYAGFLWMTAAGNQEQIKKAKSMLINATIGAIILFASYAIATFIINNIMTATIIE